MSSVVSYHVNVIIRYTRTLVEITNKVNKIKAIHGYLPIKLYISNLLITFSIVTIKKIYKALNT